jgi:hypothetical protein
MSDQVRGDSNLGAWSLYFMHFRLSALPLPPSARQALLDSAHEVNLVGVANSANNVLPGSFARRMLAAPQRCTRLLPRESSELRDWVRRKCDCMLHGAILSRADL